MLRCIFPLCLLVFILPTVTESFTHPELEIWDVERGTSFITIGWNLTDPNNTVQAWRVNVEDRAMEYIASYDGSANINLLAKTASVFVHQSNTKYNVCLEGFLKNEAAIMLKIEKVATCGIYSTIPVLLRSSLIPLIIVVGFFTLLVLIGAVAYKIKECRTSAHNYKLATANEPILTTSARKDIEVNA